MSDQKDLDRSQKSGSGNDNSEDSIEEIEVFTNSDEETLMSGKWCTNFLFSTAIVVMHYNYIYD